MVKVEEWTTIRTLRAKGLPIRKIARVCKVSRNTVRRVIREEVRTIYERKAKEVHVLKGFEKDLQEMAEKQFIGSRMLEELRKRGDSGSSATCSNSPLRLLSDNTFDHPPRLRTNPPLTNSGPFPYLTDSGKKALTVFVIPKNYVPILLHHTIRSQLYYTLLFLSG